MFSLSANQWKVILLSGLGGALEFYDFVVFAIFAMVIGETFFPNSNELLSTLSAFLAFAAGYLARPVGGIIFSHFGDKYGRKNSFILSISLMAIATILMGILPGFSQWGIAAAVIFILLRLVQGMAIGGEIPGAITFVEEHVSNRPGFACGIIFLCINVGILLGDGTRAILTTFIEPALAWRVAFIIGGALAVVSYFLRKKLSESPAFEANTTKHNIPIVALFKLHFKNLIAGTMVVATQATLVSVFYLFIVSYMKIAGGYADTTISGYTLVNLALFSLMCAVFGGISDYYSKKGLLAFGMICLIPCVFWLCYSITSHTTVMIAYLTSSIFCGMIAGIFSAFLASLFSTSVKFSGIAVSYNLGFAIFGGLTPAIMTYFIHATGSYFVPAYTMTSVVILGLIGLLLAKPYHR